MNTSTRFFAVFFAVALLSGGLAGIASARADAASRAEIEGAYEYDYLPSQLVDPAAAYGEHIETF